MTPSTPTLVSIGEDRRTRCEVEMSLSRLEACESPGGVREHLAAFQCRCQVSSSMSCEYVAIARTRCCPSLAPSDASATGHRHAFHIDDSLDHERAADRSACSWPRAGPRPRAARPPRGEAVRSREACSFGVDRDHDQRRIEATPQSSRRDVLQARADLRRIRVDEPSAVPGAHARRNASRTASSAASIMGKWTARPVEAVSPCGLVLLAQRSAGHEAGLTASFIVRPPHRCRLLAQHGCAERADGALEALVDDAAVLMPIDRTWS